MLILKGIVIGIGKIIPGVSGSMLAISMGIYQKLIDSINNLLKNPKENIKFLLKISIGVIISIIFFSNLIVGALNKYYLVTMFLFIGLIIGGLDDIKVNIDKKNNKIVFISFIIITILGLINIDNEVVITNSLLNFIFFVFVGFIDALTMVIPGISGTATLMMIGAYNTLMETYSNVLDLSLIHQNIKILLPFVIGMIIGIVITVKIINWLFKYHTSKTYSAILGFSASTIVLMGIRCINTSYSLSNLIIAFILLFIGMYVTKKINHYFSND